MTLELGGLHHVTAISSDLARTTEFYRHVLGLKLVREARNDDDPDARHFWFGDADGAMGDEFSGGKATGGDDLLDAKAATAPSFLSGDARDLLDSSGPAPLSGSGMQGPSLRSG